MATDPEFGDWPRLGRVVRETRIRRGYRTQRALAEAMQVSSKLINNIEQARNTSYSEASLVGLEMALGWESGSVRSILSGGAPICEPTVREPDPELLHASREWIYRHSSQPDGDRWTDNPSHLDWAAENLLVDLAPWLKTGLEHAPVWTSAFEQGIREGLRRASPEDLIAEVSRRMGNR